MTIEDLMSEVFGGMRKRRQSPSDMLRSLGGGRRPGPEALLEALRAAGAPDELTAMLGGGRDRGNGPVIEVMGNDAGRRKAGYLEYATKLDLPKLLSASKEYLTGNDIKAGDIVTKKDMFIEDPLAAPFIGVCVGTSNLEKIMSDSGDIDDWAIHVLALSDTDPFLMKSFKGGRLRKIDEEEAVRLFADWQERVQVAARAGTEEEQRYIPLLMDAELPETVNPINSENMNGFLRGQLVFLHECEPGLMIGLDDDNDPSVLAVTDGKVDVENHSWGCVRVITEDEAIRFGGTADSIMARAVAFPPEPGSTEVKG